jgi:pimeloyl-ACP methyl ester carboxylesterase
MRLLDCGHWVQVQRPAAVADAISEVLDESGLESESSG